MLYGMLYDEDDLLPISALQHLLFCPRQCALIHNEQSWVENQLTAEGRLLHKNAESGKSTTRNGIRITRDLPLRSLQRGLAGKADIVEFHPPPEVSKSAASRTLRQWIHEQRQESLAGWTILPVEYKRGQPKQNDCDRVQLMAQTFCLEEMLGVTISQGALFYGQQQHRHDVIFDSQLRQITDQAIADLRALFVSRKTPPAEYSSNCNNCSLYDICLPKSFATSSASNWLKQQLKKSF